MKRGLALLLLFLLGLCSCGRAEREATTTTSLPTTTETPTLPPNETEPINHTVTQRIHPDMGEFTFTLRGVLRNRYYNISTIVIFEEGGPFHQRLEGFETLFFLSDDYGFSFDDFNSDGYLDMQLLAHMGGSSANLPSFFWLWDCKQGEYVRNQQLEELSGIHYVAMDGERVKCSSTLTMGYHLCWHEYRNGAFVEVEMEEFDHSSEEDGLSRHTFHKKLINGKMKTIQDTTEKVWEATHD